MMDEIEERLPSDKSELMALIQRERAALEEAMKDLSEEEMTRPGPEGWSVKDHLAHIVTWEQILLIHYMKGRSFAEATAMDEATAKAMEGMNAEEGLNDFFFNRDKGRPLAEVLADFRESHRRVLAALERESFESLMRPYRDDRPLLNWVKGDTYGHYQEHRQIIETITGKGN
jgi:uncharacterized protein (TIGR03083 family)